MTGRARPIPTASRTTVARMTIRARLTKTVDSAGRSAGVAPTLAPKIGHMPRPEGSGRLAATGNGKVSGLRSGLNRSRHHHDRADGLATFQVAVPLSGGDADPLRSIGEAEQEGG